MFKKGISLVLLLASMLTLCSCKSDRFSYCEIGIVLTKDFCEYETEDFNIAYSDGKTVVGIRRISFESCQALGMLTTWTPLKLASLQHEELDIDTDAGVETHGDVPFFTYTLTHESGGKYFYMPTFYRTRYAYFIITFITPEYNKDEGRAEFLKYAESVYILEEYLQ